MLRLILMRDNLPATSFLTESNGGWTSYGEAHRMPGVQAVATTLIAFGMSLVATYLRSVEFFKHPLLEALGLPLGIVLALVGALLLGVRAMRWRTRSSFSGIELEIWICLGCGQSNEGSLRACWSCGLPSRLSKATPSHIPVEARWQCARCKVWNGVGRLQCWHCGLERHHDEAT